MPLRWARCESLEALPIALFLSLGRHSRQGLVLDAVSGTGFGKALSERGNTGHSEKRRYGCVGFSASRRSATLPFEPPSSSQYPDAMGPEVVSHLSMIRNEKRHVYACRRRIHQRRVRHRGMRMMNGTYMFRPQLVH